MADAVQWDPRALEQVLARSQPLRSELERLGRKGVAFGEANAPDAAPLRQGYIDSFVWSIGHLPNHVPVLAIANTDWKAWWIEHGTAPHATAPGGHQVSMRAYHILDRTLDELRS
jgi:hypothetical protein